MSSVSSVIEVVQVAPRPSLYAAIRLARLVSLFRDRLKARVKSRAQPPTVVQCQNLGVQAFNNRSDIPTVKRLQGNVSKEVGCLVKRITGYRRNRGFTPLLQELDSLATRRSQTLVAVASDDHLFLQHAFHRITDDFSVKRISHILDLTTLLLERLQHTFEPKAGQSEGHAAYASLDGLECDKFIANLVHILRCLQQAALDALIRHSLERLAIDIHQLYDSWQQQKPLDDGWFAEWPSGRRPLSTTWPWNIKPSLIVLWGVCWMFYYNNATVNEGSGEASQGGAAWPPGPQQAFSGGTTRTQNSSSRSNPTQNCLQNSGRWSAWAGAISGVETLSESNESALIGSRFTSASEANESRLHVPASTLLGLPELCTNNTIPFHSRGASGNSHIIQGSAPSSIAFATPTTVEWPQNQGRSTGHTTVSHNDWQQPKPDHINSTTPTSQYSYSDSSPLDNTYVGNFPHLTTEELYNHWSTPPAFNPSQSLGLYLEPTMQLTTNYPSPRSDRSGSGRATSQCLPSMAVTVSQNAPLSSSPTRSPVFHSDNFAHDEPPRNSFNKIYCSHPECAANPPEFARKCEWTKHKDKHDRPYVCEEDGCEKIQGFTYSGGLLRHQREVHKQHGGPKAPQMCPHRDCKRSKSGFSRKENLNEHLRRVHRAGIDDDDVVVSQQQQQIPQLGEQRKRRRTLEENDEDQTHGYEGLRAENKRLRDEILEKDGRLKELQAMLQKIIGSGIRK